MFAFVLLSILITVVSGTTPPSTRVSPSFERILTEMLERSNKIQEEAQSMREEAQSMREEAQSMREEAQSVREEAHNMREEAQSVREEAHNMREKNQSVREEVLTIRQEGYEAVNQAYDVLFRAFTLVQSQSSDNVRQIQNSHSLTSIVNRLDRIESVIDELNDTKDADSSSDDLKSLMGQLDSKMGQLDSKMGQLKEESNEKSEAISTSLNSITSRLGQMESVMGQLDDKLEDSNDKVVSLDEKTTSMKEQVDFSLVLVTTVKRRQQTWMSEVRLISLYKMTDETSIYAHSDAGVLTDGMFTFSEVTSRYMITYSDTADSHANNKIWIKLGGLFRVYKVMVWNIRHIAQERFHGAQVYVDETLIGTAAGTHDFYKFLVPEEDPVYGSIVTLNQPRSVYTSIIEVQVWGNGPFDKTDIFA